MDFAVLDLGSEKLVARYVGPAEWMAFNESVLRESLASLQGQRLVVREPVPRGEAGVVHGTTLREWSGRLARAGRLGCRAGWAVAMSGPARSQAR